MGFRVYLLTNGLSIKRLDTQADLAVSIILVFVEVPEGDFHHTTLKLLGGNLGTLGARHESLAADRVGEQGRGLDVIPILGSEGINDLLLSSFLSFC